MSSHWEGRHQVLLLVQDAAGWTSVSGLNWYQGAGSIHLLKSCHYSAASHCCVIVWRVFCCAHTLSSSWFYPPLSEKSPLLSAGPSCLICRSPFSLSLIVIFTISFYLSDRVFIFSLSLRIFFIPKSHFLHSARQTCSSRDVLYNDVSMSDSRAESYIL